LQLRPNAHQGGTKAPDRRHGDEDDVPRGGGRRFDDQRSRSWILGSRRRVLKPLRPGLDPVVLKNTWKTLSLSTYQIDDHIRTFMDTRQVTPCPIGSGLSRRDLDFASTRDAVA